MIRNSRIEQIPSTESQDDYYQVKSDLSSESQNHKPPSCCEFACTDYIITLLCFLMLTVTLIGYVTIFINDSDISDSDKNKLNGTVNDFPFPQSANETLYFEDDVKYTEFFLRCRVSVEKQFLMGCSRIEAHLVMKDIARILTPENNNEINDEL